MLPSGILCGREAEGRIASGRPAGVFPLRPTHLRSRQARGAVGAGGLGARVLIFPGGQRERPDWADGLDRCGACGGTRLSAMLGEVVCRACGHTERA